MQSCQMVKKCPDCFTPPEPLVLRLVDSVSGNDLIYSDIYKSDSIKLYYLENGVRKDLDASTHKDIDRQRVIIYSGYVGWKSATGFKDFYLYLNYKTTIQIYVDDAETHDDCCTYFLRKAVKANQKNISLDRSEYLYVIKL